MDKKVVESIRKSIQGECVIRLVDCGPGNYISNGPEAYTSDIMAAKRFSSELEASKFIDENRLVGSFCVLVLNELSADFKEPIIDPNIDLSKPGVKEIVEREKQDLEKANNIVFLIEDMIFNYHLATGNHATELIIHHSDYSRLLRFKRHIISSMYVDCPAISSLKAYRTLDIKEGEIKVF